MELLVCCAKNAVSKGIPDTCDFWNCENQPLSGNAYVSQMQLNDSLLFQTTYNKKLKILMP